MKAKTNIEKTVIGVSNFDHSFKGPMLKLKLPYFGHPMQTGNSLEKTLILGKIEARRKR